MNYKICELSLIIKIWFKYNLITASFASIGNSGNFAYVF